MIRLALRTLVARDGFHGASMSAVAKEAGVASGTAYVHYQSKDDLIVAAYHEAKAAITHVCITGFNSQTLIEDRFRSLWLGLYHHLCVHPNEARFLLQVQASPYRQAAYDHASSDPDNELVALIDHPELRDRLVPLPPTVLWELGVSPAIWLAAQGSSFDPVDDQQLIQIANGCWRAITLN